MKAKVVITGVGIITATGTTLEELSSALLKGESFASPIENVNVSAYPVKYACQIKNLKVGNFLSAKEAKHMEKSSLYGVIAAKEAVADAQLNIKDLNQDRIEIYEGTSIGGMEKIFSDHEILLSKGYHKLHPFTPIRAFIGSTTGEIAITLGTHAKSITISSGSASGNDAIGLGFERVQTGDIDVAIVGASESPIVSAIIATFSKMGVASTRDGDPKKAYRPFSIDRDGFVLGEGAAFLILENLSHAKKRNAKIYAELAGYGASCDAYHMVAPHPEGLGIQIATERALTSAKAELKDVDYINAHGTGTLLNDKYETLAFKKIFGADAYQIPISGTKPIMGHLLGACGAVEALICLLAVKDSILPATINYLNPDPECDLNYIPNSVQKKNVDLSLSYTYGFGGKNSVIAIRKYKD